MSQDLSKNCLTRASLRQSRSSRTVLLRMAADEARAQRIKELKASRPDLTWRRIGDAVGVSERSALAWRQTGAMEYANAKKLAKVFEVDADWLWRGPKSQTPDLFSGDGHGELAAKPRDDRQAQLDRIEEKLNRQYRMLADILEKLGTPEGVEAMRDAMRLLRELGEAEAAGRDDLQAGEDEEGGREEAG